MGFSGSAIAAAAGIATIGLSKSAIALELGPLTGLSASAFTAAEAAGQAPATNVFITDAASVTAALAYRRANSITVDPTCAINVALPNLRRTVAGVLVDNTGEGNAEILLDKLKDVGATLQIIGAGWLADFSADELETVGGSVALGGGYVPTFVLPKLRTVGSAFSATSCMNTTLISAPLLETVGQNLASDECEALTSFSMPTLTSVNGNATFNGNISFTPASLSLGSLSTVGPGNAGAVTISGNRTVGVNGLSDAVATALVAQLVGPPAYTGVATISDNTL